MPRAALRLGRGHRARPNRPRSRCPGLRHRIRLRRRDCPAGPRSATSRTRCMLAVLDLQTRKATWLTLPEAGGTEKAPRELRWSMPVLSDDGAVAVASVRSSDNKDRWLVRDRPGDRQGHGARPPARRGLGARGLRARVPELGWLPASHRLWFTSERTGWMHLYTRRRRRRRRQPRALTSGRVGDHRRRTCPRTAARST